MRPRGTVSGVLRAPQQRRSAATLDRILVATEALLRQRPFSQISIAEIVGDARTSAGSFYARFPDKDALLPALYQRYETTMAEHTEGLTSGADWPPDSLKSTTELIVRYFVSFFRGRLELLRALALHVREAPEVGPQSSTRRAAQHRVFVDAILAHRSEIAHPDPARAAELGLYLVVCACRDRILFGHSTHAVAVNLSENELVTETARMLCGYLRLDESSPIRRA